jgi:hypothetical protein
MPTLVIQLFKFILGSMIRVTFFALKDMEKENLYLRYQLIILKREVSGPRFKETDRFILSSISMHFSKWRSAAFIARPETILKWHRSLAAKRWSTDSI